MSDFGPKQLLYVGVSVVRFRCYIFPLKEELFIGKEFKTCKGEGTKYWKKMLVFSFDRNRKLTLAMIFTLPSCKKKI
jgi:hypothetical protein